MYNFQSKEITFTHNSGRTIELHHFHLELTYQSLVEGPPDPNLNLDIINAATPPSHWRKTPILKIWPTKQEIESVLPPFCCSALLESCNAESFEMSDSQLTVIWFTDNVNKYTLPELLKINLENIDWDTFAEECEIF